LSNTLKVLIGAFALTGVLLYHHRWWCNTRF
jgi:hypothetical protein